MNKYQEIDDPYFVEFIYSLCEREDDFFGRRILISPYYGAYSKIAGFVITVVGTPPKATIYFPIGNYKAIINISPIKVIHYNDEYERLIGFLERYEIDRIYKIELR